MTVTNNPVTMDTGLLSSRKTDSCLSIVSFVYIHALNEVNYQCYALKHVTVTIITVSMFL